MDHRTLREKLERMAERGTQHEREVATAKLAAMDSRPPNRPPTRNGAPPGPLFDPSGGGFSWTTSSTNADTWTTVTFGTKL